MIHYHGTPLTPRAELQKMAGKHFCVSFAAPGDAEWCQRHGQSVMWDNGAFSAYTAGRKFDPTAFSEWVAPRLAHPHWAVVPDVIDGDVSDQRDLIASWHHPPILSAPVWHMGLPIDWLLELSAKWPRICFGSSGAYWQVGSEVWERRCDEAWNALEQAGVRPWVHMLRGLSLSGSRWPFASADSVNVARNFKNKGAEQCPERMARAIDAVQPYQTTWTMRQQQKGLFAT